MTTGVIGLGRMGHAIAERLAEEGHDLVLWNRTLHKAHDIAGAAALDSPAAVAARAEAVISVQADDAAIETVYFGADGLCSRELAGTVVVEMCTTLPDRVHALEAAVTDRGGRFLECPVGGTVGPAREGRLLGLAGGSAEAFAAARPVLDRLTRRLEHLGPAGTGAAMKLAINLPLMVYWSALGEAVSLATAGGVPPERAFDILSDSSGAVASLRNRAPALQTFLETGEADSAKFDLANGVKDMRLMEALAEAHGLPAPTIAAARARAEAAEEGGWGERDVALYGLFDLVSKS